MSLIKWNIAVTIIIFAIIYQPYFLYAYPSGAPSQVCGTMTPGHGSEQQSQSPFNISASSNTYENSQIIKVTITGGDYQGILLLARIQGNSQKRLGQWSSFPANTRGLQCTSTDDAVTHLSQAVKNGVEYTWTAPEDFDGNIEIIATVAQSQYQWWKNHIVLLTKYTGKAEEEETTTNSGNSNSTTSVENDDENNETDESSNPTDDDLEDEESENNETEKNSTDPNDNNKSNSLNGSAVILFLNLIISILYCHFYHSSLKEVAHYH